MHERMPGVEPGVTVIEPARGFGTPDWTAVWRLRGLLSVFLWRDIAVRYKQTMLGVFWIVLQPLMVTAIYSVFFGYIARIPTERSEERRVGKECRSRWS